MCGSSQITPFRRCFISRIDPFVGAAAGVESVIPAGVESCDRVGSLWLWVAPAPEATALADTSAVAEFDAAEGRAPVVLVVVDPDCGLLLIERNEEIVMVDPCVVTSVVTIEVTHADDGMTALQRSRPTCWSVVPDSIALAILLHATVLPSANSMADTGSEVAAAGWGACPTTSRHNLTISAIPRTCCLAPQITASITGTEPSHSWGSSWVMKSTLAVGRSCRTSFQLTD